MKSFAIACLLAVASVEANDPSKVPQAAVDKVFKAKQAGLAQDPATTPAAPAAPAAAGAPATPTAPAPTPVAWLPSTLPPCPSPERTMMDDGKTHVVKYPYVGATCKVVSALTDTSKTAAPVTKAAAPLTPKSLVEVSEDAEEEEEVSEEEEEEGEGDGEAENEAELDDEGKPKAKGAKPAAKGAAPAKKAAAPAKKAASPAKKAASPAKKGDKKKGAKKDKKGSKSKSKSKGKKGKGKKKGKKTAIGKNGFLSDGTIKGSIPQKPLPWQKKILPWQNLEHCPDPAERRTLKDGKTTAVAWPALNFNCHNEGPLMQLNSTSLN